LTPHDRLRQKLERFPDSPEFRVERGVLEEVLREWDELYPPQRREDLECLYDKPMVVGVTTDWDYLHYVIGELEHELAKTRHLLTNRMTYPTYCVVTDTGDPCAENHIVCEATRDQYADEGWYVGQNPYALGKYKYYQEGP
jgi:hypothetical protein